jgi:hypothetical protein
MKKKTIIKYWGLYHPILLAFISVLYSVGLWFTGNQLEGIFVGIVGTIVFLLYILIRLETKRIN